MTSHLIHVGYTKAGSTTLGAWFDAHPQLAYAPNGLGGFYHAFEISIDAVSGRPERAWHVTSSENLLRPTGSNAPSPHAPPIDLAGIAEHRARACRTLQAVFPGATILIVTRGFRSIIAAGYAQYVAWGGTRRLADVLEWWGPQLPVFLDYDEAVHLYREAFGADRVIVLPFELLRDDAPAFARALHERLGLDGDPPPMPRLNPALSSAALFWYRPLSRPVALAARLLGARLGRLVFGAYVLALQRDPLHGLAERLARRRPRCRLTPADVPDEVAERFRGKASSLRDLPHYAPYAADYLNDG